MALTANPLQNATSAKGDISSQKSFQNFSQINPTQGTSFLQSQPANYMIYNSTNKTFIDTLLGNLGLSNFGYTAFVVMLGNHEVWATRTPVASSGLPAGNTVFTLLYFDGNEVQSSGDLAFP